MNHKNEDTPPSVINNIHTDNSVNFGDKSKIKNSSINTNGDTLKKEQKTVNTQVNIEKKDSFWSKLLPWNWFKK